MARVIYGSESAPLLWVSERCLDYKVEARELGINPPDWPQTVTLERAGRPAIICTRTGSTDDMAWYWIADMTGQVYIMRRDTASEKNQPLK